DNGTQSEMYLAINPQGKVPSMVDGDFVLTESAAIVNYIAHKNPSAQLIPEDGTKARARYDEMCYFIMTELEQPLWTAGKHKFALPEEVRVPAILDKTIAFEFAKAQKTLEVMLGDRPYAAGDVFTMADVLLYQTLEWAVAFKFQVTDALFARYQSYQDRDALKRAHALR
ncbi:MAG: glutathione S-transferase family protein, partial [Pseudomonadota bacterium]